MQAIKVIRYLIIIFFLSYYHSLAFKSAVKSNNISDLQIVSSSYEDKTLLGLKFNIKNDWKIYGQNTEDISQQPKISFSKKLNYKIIWPQAISETEEIGDEKLIYNAYKQEVIIPIEISDSFQKEQEIDVKVNYAICKDICIPVNENITIKLNANDFDQESLTAIQQYMGQKEIKLSIFYAIILAIIGGFILNFMPCVFPVLSIKLLGLIKYHNHSTSQLRLIYLSTIAGNIFTFIIIASFIVIFKEIGQSFGWGLQFQNPYFLVVLATIVFYFAIYTLKGNIQISGNILSSLNNKINHNKNGLFLPNFLSGILTVLLSTPCSAPFLGSAISFALSQNIFEIFTILIAISLGLATPYFLLLIYPALTYKLPKPGAWMEKAKKLMFALLVATFAWLLFVLSNFVGLIGCIIITTILLISLKYFRKNNKNTLISIIITTIFIFFIPFFINQKATKINQKHWIEFNQKKISTLVAQNKIVIINITADWCLTCKVNEIRVFSSKEFTNLIVQDNIIAMNGDLTKPNQEILDFIKSHHRQAIPFTIIYSHNFPKGILTNEIISKKNFLELITKLSNK